MSQKENFSIMLLIAVLLNFCILVHSIKMKNGLHEATIGLHEKKHNLDRLYVSGFGKIKKREYFESNNKAEVINDLITQKLIERLKSLYVVTTRSR